MSISQAATAVLCNWEDNRISGLHWPCITDYIYGIFINNLQEMSISHLHEYDVVYSVQQTHTQLFSAALLPQPFHCMLAWDRHQICWLAYPVAWLSFIVYNQQQKVTWN